MYFPALKWIIPLTLPSRIEHQIGQDYDGDIGKLIHSCRIVPSNDRRVYFHTCNHLLGGFDEGD